MDSTKMAIVAAALAGGLASAIIGTVKSSEVYVDEPSLWTVILKTPSGNEYIVDHDLSMEDCAEWANVQYRCVPQSR